MMRNVLVDLSHLDDFCGHGEITRNFAPFLAACDDPDLHFIFMVPERFSGKFGSKVSYVSCEHLKRDLAALGLHVDLWHSTDQQFKVRASRRNCIRLLTVHDLNFLLSKTGIHRLRHIFELRWRVLHSDYVVTISKYVQNDLRRFLGRQADKVPVSVIYNGIADVVSQPQRKPAVAEGREHNLLITVGRLRERKNYHTLIPMMKYLPDFQLVICGNKKGAYAAQLQEQIESLHLSNVITAGEITDEEKNWLYAHAAALLFPSKFEGFGLPVLEAMRFRCKVFSSRFSCMPEICGKYASYFDSYDPQDMADLVRRDVASWDKNSAFAAEMQAYSESFNYHNYTLHYLRLYRQLLGLPVKGD